MKNAESKFKSIWNHMTDLGVRFRETPKEKRTRKANKNVIYGYFKSNSTQRVYRKKIIEIWSESTKFNASQRLPDQVILI